MLFHGGWWNVTSLVEDVAQPARSQWLMVTQYHARSHMHKHTWRSNWPHALIASCSSSGQCSRPFGTAAVHGDISICYSVTGCRCSETNVSKNYNLLLSLFIYSMLFISYYFLIIQADNQYVDQNFILWIKGDKHYIGQWPNYELWWHWISFLNRIKCIRSYFSKWMIKVCNILMPLEVVL